MECLGSFHGQLFSDEAAPSEPTQRVKVPLADVTRVDYKLSHWLVSPDQRHEESVLQVEKAHVRE